MKATNFVAFRRVSGRKIAVGTTKAYSGQGADIVMESISLINWERRAWKFKDRSALCSSLIEGFRAAEKGETCPKRATDRV
jgi:hypothetical protein